MEGRVKGEVGFLCVGLSDSGEVDIDGFLNLEEEDEKGENKRALGYPSALSSPYTCNSGPPYGSRMLCFGGEDGFVSSGFPMKQTTGKGGGMNDTSTPSTSSSSSNNSLSIQRSKGKEGRLGGSQKKPRRDQQPSSSANKNGSATKMRKERLGERITALQQLVSPFGKSDTASVLHEALGYIKFLHDQVQVLSSPYLQQLPSPSNTQVGGTRVDLRSRGLCLVPISCTAHVAGSNGADLWASDHGE